MSKFEELRLDVCLAAEQWFMHRSGRGIPHTKSLADAEAALEKIAEEWLDTKIAMVKASIEKSRSESPDGMTSWDRVEKFRIEHGHLPHHDGSAELGCPKCAEEHA